jgi:hypothetical protein
VKDDRLRNLLSKLPMPEGSEAVRARARHRALIAFEQEQAAPSRQDNRGAHGWWGFGIGLTMLVAVAVALLLFPRYRVSDIHQVTENLANDRQILQQTELLFPNQVDAIVVKNGKADLALAQVPLVGSDQPVVVIFRKDSESIRVLSYSGHHVCITLGHEQHCFDILATTAGGVILESNDKAWLASEHTVVAGYSVRAQMLATSL